MSTFTRASRWLIAPALLLSLAACGESSVSQSDLETQIDKLFTSETGLEAEKVECEDGLKAEEGAKQRCTITTTDDSLDVDAEVTSIDGDTVNFDITEVAE